MENRIRVGIVDDHASYREGVAFALESEPDLLIVGEGETAHDAFRLARDHAPDVLLLDVNMPGGEINAVASIASHCPSTKTVMLTVVDDKDEVRSAIGKGARGYLLKGISSSELVSTIRLVNDGGSYVSPDLAVRLFMGVHGRE
jgi:DNA-binding NarL/FixJ family response regulator